MNKQQLISKFLTLIILICMLGSNPEIVKADDQILPNNQQDLTAAINKSRQELNQKKQEVAQLNRQSQEFKERLLNLEAESEAAKAEQKRLIAQLDFAKSTFEQRSQEYNDAQEQLLTKEAAYRQRFSTMFYYRQRSWWEMLLQSKGLGGFFTNIRLMEAIAKADQRMLVELEHSKAIAELQRKIAEETKIAFMEYLEAKEKELSEKQDEILTLKSDQQELAKTLVLRGTEEQNLEATLAEQMAAKKKYEENSKRLAAKIKKMEQQKAAQLASQRAVANSQSLDQNSVQNTNDGYNLDSLLAKYGSETDTTSSQGGKAANNSSLSAGSFTGSNLSGYSNGGGGKATWPIPGHYEVWSPYGYRSLGVDAANNYLHTGIDLSSPNAAGSPVVAAWSGIVVAAEQPYPGQMVAPQANYVQINHGNGFGSGYWHLMDVTVQVGQSVNAGDVIGHCGSTGWSTGPHLHFEVYDANSPHRSVRNTVDPAPYLN